MGIRLQLLKVSSLLLLSLNVFGSIGNITTHEGIGEINRGKDKFVTESKLSIEQLDDIRTGNGKIGITFEDSTKVKISRNSSLIIDSFIYDAKTGKGELSLKATIGTVRYASGLIAKRNRKRVKISTPSANIAVRGTAFSMTVDELGQSLIILLPNADGTVGEIAVSTGMGMVILNQAFQATATKSLEMTPSKPVLLDLNESQINNMLLVTTPKNIKDAFDNPLDFDPLEFNELDIAVLDFNELDINELDVDLLYSPLDDLTVGHIDGRTAGFNKVTQVNTIITETEVRIIRQVGDSIDIKTSSDYAVEINLNQGQQLLIQTGDNPTSIFNIYQN
jgi:hypothetical protein